MILNLSPSFIYAYTTNGKAYTASGENHANSPNDNPILIEFVYLEINE